MPTSFDRSVRNFRLRQRRQNANGSSTHSNYVISMETVPISIMSLQMKLSAVTLTEGPIGICISVGLQQSENDDYAECAFLWLVNIISQYQLLDEFTRNFETMKTTLRISLWNMPFQREIELIVENLIITRKITDIIECCRIVS